MTPFVQQSLYFFLSPYGLRQNLRLILLFISNLVHCKLVVLQCNILVVLIILAFGLYSHSSYRPFPSLVFSVVLVFILIDVFSRDQCGPEHFNPFLVFCRLATTVNLYICRVSDGNFYFDYWCLVVWRPQ